MTSYALPLSAALALVLAAVSPQSAAQQQKKLVLENVTPPSGTPTAWTESGHLAIPMSTARVAGDGNIVIDCDRANHNANCDKINIGTSSGGSGSIDPATVPTFTLSGPTNTVTSSTGITPLTWNVSNGRADTCYGLSATTTTNGAPAVTGWTKEWSTNSSFTTLSTLYSAVQSTAGIAANTDVPYVFTLRCYSKTKLLGGLDAVAIYDAQRPVTIRKSGTPEEPPPGGTGYCSEYYPAGHAAHSQPGFTTPLTKVEHSFNTVFGVTLSSLLTTGGTRTLTLPGGYGQQGAYLAIPLDIPASTADQTGMVLTWSQEQDGGQTTPAYFEMSISPCPGDFRAKPSDNSSADLWSRAYCRYESLGEGGHYNSTGTTGTPANMCFLPKGKRLYLNITQHNLSNYRSNPQQQPVYTCPSGTCGWRFTLKRYQE